MLPFALFMRGGDPPGSPPGNSPSNPSTSHIQARTLHVYREREREITLYDIIEHFYNILIIQMFATHFPGMKNKRGGSYFSFHGKHAVLFFQVEGWPH